MPRMATMASDEILEFGSFRLVVGRRELLLNDQPVPLGPRAFDVLLAMLQRFGEIVSRGSLMAEVWPKEIVEEGRLYAQVSLVRKALATSTDGKRYLITVPGRGYQFVGPVRRLCTALPSAFGHYECLGIAPLPLPNKPSIVVLPFTNLSADLEQEYFADGISEDITTALSRFYSLFVIARNSAFTYKGRSVDVSQIGRELGVRYVVEGSVRRHRSRLRISAQLVEADTRAHLWADQYDGDIGDVFELQDDITARIVGDLVPKLQKAEIDRARKKTTSNLDAYDLYLQALVSFYAWTREGNDQALSLLARSLKLDPHFVSAILIEENCWAARYAHGWSPMDDAIAQSTRCARLAVQIDPTNADALAVLARRTPSISGDYKTAIALAERAVSLNPNSAFAWRCTAYALMLSGEPHKAVEHCQHALRLSPRDPRAYDALTALALAKVQLGEDEDAISAARSALQQNPEWVGAWRVLTAALALSGRLKEARGTLRTTIGLDPTFSRASIGTRLGFSEKARDRLFKGWALAGAR